MFHLEDVVGNNKKIGAVSGNTRRKQYKKSKFGSRSW